MNLPAALMSIAASAFFATVTDAFSPSASSTYLPSSSLANNCEKKLGPVISQIVPFKASEAYFLTALSARPSSDDEGLFGDIQINIPYAFAYVFFLGFAYFMTTVEAPGASQVILDKFLADPVNPGVNELFASIFNLLGLAPLPIACLTMPSAKGQKPPTAPFLLGGVFAGYGSIGIMMSTRKEATRVSMSDLGFVTKNVLENKIFNVAIAALAISVFFSTGFVEGTLADATGQLQGYTEVLKSSAIVSASSCDLAILTLSGASLIPEDLKRRGIDDPNKASVIAASTVFLPIVGMTLYCAFRPSLPEE